MFSASVLKGKCMQNYVWSPSCGLCIYLHLFQAHTDGHGDTGTDRDRRRLAMHSNSHSHTLTVALTFIHSHSFTGERVQSFLLGIFGESSRPKKKQEPLPNRCAAAVPKWKCFIIETGEDLAEGGYGGSY